MIANIPEKDQTRIVIIGAGFAGLQLAKRLSKTNYQVVLIDKLNYHQFQPLMYQVATSGLEPSSIAFPLRKLFHHVENVYIRNDEVIHVDTVARKLNLKHLGHINYDKLVIAYGADTNYFGNANVEANALPMKSIPEALSLRNRILGDFEKAISITDFNERQRMLDFVIVGGGATGVEVAGALADMRRDSLPKDFPELDASEVDIYLVDSQHELLSAMSDKSRANAEKSLIAMGVKVIKGVFVSDFDGEVATLSDGRTIPTNKVIWAAGVIARTLPGLPAEAFGRGRRLLVDSNHKLVNEADVYALGDCALMMDDNTPSGHPQVAQVALQQASNLGNNFIRELKGKEKIPFRYKDYGSMATIGRKRAVAELGNVKFTGFFAWLTWLFVHLMAILGAKNKILVFINWFWAYVTRDQSLRLILKPSDDKVNE